MSGPNRADAEQLQKKRLDVLERKMPVVEMHRIIKKLQQDLVADMPESRVTESRLVTPGTVMREKVSDEGPMVSISPTGDLEDSLGQPVENPLAVIQFRDEAKAKFLSHGWTEADFNKLVGDEALRQLTADGQVEGESGVLRKLIALALGEQVHDIVPVAVENTGPKSILDNGCPFHIARAYIDKYNKEFREDKRVANSARNK